MEPFIKVLQAQNIQDIYIKTIDYTTKHCMCYLILVYKRGELRLGGNHAVTEYEMSGEPYSQKSGWIIHSNE